MFERWSLKFPITLGVTMIILIIALIVGWIILTTFIALQSQQAGFYWMLLSVGTVFFAILLTGVIFYLTLSVKAINLTKRQSNFIDSVTHELKSPIASLKLYLQTLDMRDVSKEEQARFLKFMMNDVDRLDNLITHLLEAGYAETTREHESVAAVEVSEVIRQAVESVMLRYRVDASVFQLDLEPCLISMPIVDATMIFRNLIDNAVKYAGTPPSISVSVQLYNETVTCRIADNGRGIPKALRRKIFGRFVRLGKELRREKPGTGLGLHIVNTLVRRAGGEVSVIDPVHSADSKRSPAHEHAATQSSPTDAKTIFEVRLPGRKLPGKLTEKENAREQAAGRGNISFPKSGEHSTPESN